MGQVRLNPAGSIDLADLAVVLELQGQDSLPYPFMATNYSRTSLHAEAGRFTSLGPDHPDQTDSRVFGQWAQTYRHADLRVECRVHYASEGDPDRRILAHRADQLGFFASQRSGEDVVDISTLSPYELGAAIATAVGLSRPGAHSRIVIPGYVGYFINSRNDFDDRHETTFTRPVRVITDKSTTVIPNADVTALATIQSHWQPARSWGADWDKKLVVWVRIKDDGDYVYAPDFGHATPLTEKILSERIDRLIAEDVAVLREQRGMA